ncbi:hypothetical protein ACFOWZ_11785 [Lentzea rhizosphaerae]|uniref:5-bromo-4-chloroindolyl phosphate hydrolysis protein n=1 Tax=Lentzea rhizosphaerae TaxID=2041025 RepID=A0ABV8BSB3_9PSEU
MGVVVRSVLWGSAVGFVLMGALMTIGVTATAKSTDSVGISIAAVIISGVMMGGVPGSLIGLVIGLIRRSINRPRPPVPYFPLAPQQPYDMWSEQVERCAESARRVSAAVQTVPKSAAKDWLQRISEQLTKELDDVRGIAQLGRALGAVDQQHPVYQRLLKAAHDFKQFENQVGRVALQMFDHPELDDARTHLEMLEKQLPQLST